MSLQVISAIRLSTELSEINVLPFYAYSFKKLNDGIDYCENYDYNSAFRSLIYKAIAKTKTNIIPRFFYDVRNWEDYSCAAPEYMLLDELKWNTTKPLAFTIKDQIDLYFVFEHMELCMPDNTSACIIISFRDENGKCEQTVMFIKKNSHEEKFCFSFEEFIPPQHGNFSNQGIFSFLAPLFQKTGDVRTIEFRNQSLVATIILKKGNCNTLDQFI